jgi:hypothetical protein
MKSPTPGLALAATLLLVAPHAGAQTAAPNPPADRWTFSVTPYLWLPGISTKLNYGPPGAGSPTPNVGVDADALLRALEFGLMVNGEARRGRWLVATDLIYLDLGRESSSVRSVDFNPGSGPVNVSTASLATGGSTTLRGTIWSMLGGYAALTDPRATLDVVAGFRYLRLDATSDWQLSATVTGPAGSGTFPASGSIERSNDLWTAIVGVKGRAAFDGTPWFVHYYGDVGAGSSATTWQLAGGVGYAFKWGEVFADYRRLHYGAGGSRLVDTLDAGGFSLGARIPF